MGRALLYLEWSLLQMEHLARSLGHLRWDLQDNRDVQGRGIIHQINVFSPGCRDAIRQRVNSPLCRISHGRLDRLLEALRVHHCGCELSLKKMVKAVHLLPCKGLNAVILEALLKQPRIGGVGGVMRNVTCHQI